MPEAVEVRFKGQRREYFLWEGKAALHLDDPVIVEVERGRDFGRVTAVGERAQQKCSAGCEGCSAGDPSTTAVPQRKVLRRAEAGDTQRAEQLRQHEEDIRRKVIERVKGHKLSMKVSDAEWQWDWKKLTIYFTADKRVDFRDLVRDLAGLFRTRIELRQIGARDEAKRLDGVGRCGRQYCCSSWLPELRPVSLSLAKDQHLLLNPSQISGGCGRLLCCLRYEHEFYVASRKRFPKEGKTLRTARGREAVLSVDIFRERVTLRAEDGSARVVPLTQLNEEVERGTREPVPAAAGEPSSQPRDGTAAPLTPAHAVTPSYPKPRRRRRRRRGGRGGRS